MLLLKYDRSRERQVRDKVTKRRNISYIAQSQSRGIFSQVHFLFCIANTSLESLDFSSRDGSVETRFKREQFEREERAARMIQTQLNSFCDGSHDRFSQQDRHRAIMDCVMLDASSDVPFCVDMGKEP